MKFPLAFVAVLLWGCIGTSEGARSGHRGKLKRTKDDCEEPSDEEADDVEVPTVSPTPAPEVANAGVAAASVSVPGLNVAALPVPDVDGGPAVQWPFVAGGAQPLFPDGMSRWAMEASNMTAGQQWGHLKAALGPNVHTADSAMNARFMCFIMDLLVNGKNVWPLIQEDAVTWKEVSRLHEAGLRATSWPSNTKDQHLKQCECHGCGDEETEASWEPSEATVKKQTGMLLEIESTSSGRSALVA